MSIILTKSYTPPPINEKEVLRYAGVRCADGKTEELLRSAVKECLDVFTYNACYKELSVSMCGKEVDFGAFKVSSSDLAKNLSGCDRAMIFAATVGIGIDRLILKHSRLSPSRAVMLGAIGAERIEALCDMLCADIGFGLEVRPRFSPGYGDLALDVQRDIFALLDAPRKIGISLNESLSMSPTKSVTAIMGIKK